jgi:hypothetical protein
VSVQINEIPSEEGAGISPLHFLMTQKYITDERDGFGVFVSPDLTFTKIWALNHIDDTYISHTAKHMKANEFAATVLSKFPDDASGQMLRLCHRDIRAEMHAFNTPHPGNPMSKTILNAIARKQFDASQHPDGFFHSINEEMIGKASEEQRKEFLETYAEEDGARESYEQISQNARHGSMALKSERWLVFSWKPVLDRRDKIMSARNRIISAFFPSSDESKNAEIQTRHDLFDTFKDKAIAIQDSLHNSGLSQVSVTGRGYTEMMYRFLNPISAYANPFPRFSDTTTINEYLLNPEQYHESDLLGRKIATSAIISKPDGMDIIDPANPDRKYYYRASSVMKIEEKRIIANFLGEAAYKSELGSLDSEGIMAINFSRLSSASVAIKVAAKRMQMQIGQKIKGKEKYKNHNADLVYIEESTNKELIGHNIAFDVSMHLIAGGFSESKAVDTVRRFCNRVSDFSMHEEYAGNKIILQSLPGNYRKGNATIVDRAMPFLSDALAHLMPLYTSSFGVSDPVILFNNREGTPIFVSLFGKHVGGVGHTLVVGGTGSGKTFTFSYLLTTMIAKVNPKVWIIDKGESYKALCSVFGGSYMKMSLDQNEASGQKPMGFNLFRVIKDKKGNPTQPSDEDIEFIVNAISELYESRSNDIKFNANETQLIEDSIVEYFESKPIDQEGRFSAWAKVLASHNVEGINGGKIAHALKTFYEGTNKSLFEVPTSVDWDGDLIVIETGNGSSKSAPVLLGLMMQSISDYIVSKLEDDRCKLVAIDEAWALMKKPNTVAIIAMFFRTMRKHLCAVILISQTVNDFISMVSNDQSSSGDGIVDNTAHYFLLQVAPKSYIAAQASLGFSEEDIAVWKGIRAVRPFYSEIFYRYVFDGNTVSSVIRLSSTPVQYWLSTTHGKERTLRSNLVEKIQHEKNLSTLEATAEAVDHLSNKYPWGLAYA